MDHLVGRGIRRALLIGGGEAGECMTAASNGQRLPSAFSRGDLSTVDEPDGGRVREHPQADFPANRSRFLITKRLLMIIPAALVALVTACGGSSGTNSPPASSTPSSSAPATAQSSSPQQSPTPQASTSSSSSSGGIPQNGGGDHDADNSGGPSDGDGNI